MLRNIIAILLLLAASTGVVLAGEIRVLAANAVQDPLDRFAQALPVPLATRSISATA